MALPVIGPMLGKLAGKVAGAIGKGFKKLFGGPSKEVKDARSMHEKLAQDIELTHTGSHDRLQHFLSAGWKDANAKVATFFQDQLVRSGRNYDDWEGHWLRYQKAMEDGNDDLMRQLLKQATDWATTTETTSTAATTAVTNHAKASGAELDKIAAHVKTTMNAGDAALEHSKATATRAFDAMRRDADVLSRQWDETFRPRTVTHSVIIEKVETHRQAQAARVGDGGSSVSHGGPEQVSYGGERATGGPVQAGRGYVVGERGPEYFIPRHSGYIAPSSQPSPYRGPEKQTINVHLDGKVLMKHVVKNLPRQLDIRGFSR